MEDRERAVYELWARTKEFSHKISQAQRIAERGFGIMDYPYASLSFGKDSTAMVHLLLALEPSLPVMYVNCGEWDEWPDTPRVKAEFLSRCPCKFIELDGPSIIESYHEAGSRYMPDEEAGEPMRRILRRYDKSLCAVLDGAAIRRGFDGAFIGLRKEESDNRSRLFAMRGPLYYAKTRKLWACHPLAFWSSRDVWAYIVKHDLPYNELYDLDPQGRERARNGAMIGTRSARYGRLTRLKLMYPEQFNRLAAEFPEIRCYV